MVALDSSDKARFANSAIRAEQHISGYCFLAPFVFSQGLENYDRRKVLGGKEIDLSNYFIYPKKKSYAYRQIASGYFFFSLFLMPAPNCDIYTHIHVGLVVQLIVVVFATQFKISVKSNMSESYDPLAFVFV